MIRNREIEARRRYRDGTCGHVPDRQPDGERCGQPAVYEFRFRDWSIVSRGAVCAEHSGLVAHHPDLEFMRTFSAEIVNNERTDDE